MAETMVERLARLLYRQSGAEGHPNDFGEDAAWPAHVAEARQILRDMREPTDEMYSDGIGPLEQDQPPEVYWRAMIDAAVAAKV